MSDQNPSAEPQPEAPQVVDKFGLVNLKLLMAGPPPKPEWAIPGIVVKGHLVMLGGLPGVGKSVLCYLFAILKAIGHPILGQTQEPGVVLYIDEENSLLDIRTYISRLCRGLNLKPEHLDLLCKNLRVYSSLSDHYENRGGWFPMLKDVVAFYKPSMILIDTVNPACEVVDENSNSEADAIAGKLRDLMKLAGPECSMLIVKHLKEGRSKKAGDTIRGAKAWRGSVSAVVYMKRPQGPTLASGLHKSKISPDKKRAFGLEQEIFVSPSYTDDARTGLVMGLELKAQPTGQDADVEDE